MTSPTRWIVVDDEDPDVEYTGPWLTAYVPPDTLGNGLVWNSTSHTVTTNASLSYNFTGSLVAVFGTVMVFPVGPPTGTDPSWVCLVDGNPIPSHVPETTFLTVENNWVLCQSGFLPDGPHHIEVQVTVLSAGGFTFWFDYFEYVPSSSVPLDDATIYVNYTDPAIQYGPGWSVSSNSTATTMAEANLAFDFVGVQLTWFGTILANLTLEPTSATFSTYSINGTAPIRFSVPSSLGSLSPNNLTVFKTQQLPPGKHHLEVVHGGNAQTPPLTLQYFVIQNGSTSRTSSTEGNPLQSSSSSSLEPTTLPLPRPHSPPASKFPNGAVAGSVVGGILAIAALIFLVCFRRQHARKRQEIYPYGTLEVVTFLPGVEPFHAFPQESIIGEKHIPSNIIPAQSFPIQTTGKIVRADQNPEASVVVPVPNFDTAPLQDVSRSTRPAHPEGSDIRLPEREESVVELPPLYSLS